jgi:hypothetical protein
MLVAHVGSTVSEQIQVPPLSVKIEACKIRMRFQLWRDGTNIDSYYVRHCKERCKSSPNLSEELGAFPLFGLQKGQRCRKRSPLGTELTWPDPSSLNTLPNVDLETLKSRVLTCSLNENMLTDCRSCLAPHGENVGWE